MPEQRGRNHTFAAIVAATLACFAGCTGSGEARDNVRNDEWRSVSPVDADLDPDPLDALREAVGAGEFQNLHSLLIVKGGELVFEEYFGGFDGEALQYTASVSKSVGSIVLGIAMEAGLFPGLDAGILDRRLTEVLPEYSDQLSDDPRKGEILLRHALSMSGGLEWDEQTFPYSDSRNDWIRASNSDDPVGFALSRPVVAPPGTVFNYNGGYSILVSYLIQRGAGETAESFAARRLFAPLGIDAWEWEALGSGLTDTDGGLHLRPRDMAKLGQLFLNGGTWEGKRVLSEEWVIESTRPHITNDGMPDYGLQWWLGEYFYGARSTQTFLASGHGGQRIHVFPDMDLVVVITQEVFDNPFADLNAFAILSRHVLPAADSGGRLPDPIEISPETLRAFVGRYAAEGEEVQVTLTDDGLLAEAEGAPSLQLTPVDDTRFVATVAGLLDIVFEFGVGADGSVGSLRTTFGFDDTEFARVESSGS